MTIEELARLSASDVERTGRGAWRRGDHAMFRACIRILRKRTTSAARKALESLSRLGLPARSGKARAEVRRASVRAASPKPRSFGPPRGWIKRAALIAREFSADGSGTRSVYVTLLKRDGRYGLYVGETGNTPKERFDDQKSDHKAGRGFVRDYGVRPLHEVAGHLRGFSQERARAVEGELARRLKRAGFWVEGGH